MTDSLPDTLLRSVLYLPASNARALAKAATLPADALVLDLEDAVAPAAKAEARAALVAAAQAGFGARAVIGRINALATPWGHDDIAALAAAPLAAVLAPKVDGPDDIAALSAALDTAGHAPATRLWVMIETPRAVLALERIAAMATTTRLAGLVLGLNDLAKDTGIALLPGRAGFHPVLVSVVLAARAYGLAVFDGVANTLDDPARLEAECQVARDLGFDGKTLIHPAQIEPANRIFAPTAAELADAKAIVDAFADPANAGIGALRVNGRMAERLHAEQAARLLKRAAHIAGQP